MEEIRIQVRVLKIKFYTDSAFYIRFERKNFQFEAGQYLVLSVPGNPESREYSISSGETDPWLEVLVKEIPEGSFSKKIKKLKPGDVVNVEGPFGFFVLNNNEIKTAKYIFLATGTGISPFKSFIRTHSEIKYHLLHGIRFYEESYGNGIFPYLKQTICTSQDSRGNYSGRMTGFLNDNGVDTNKIYYLCGNSQMINDVSDILEESGVPAKNIRSEVFF